MPIFKPLAIQQKKVKVVCETEMVKQPVISVFDVGSVQSVLEYNF